MAMFEFKLEELLNLDAGRVVEAFNQAIRRCVLDCDDRPGVKKPRRVSLNCNMVPVVDETGQLDSVNVQFDVTDSAPKRKSKVYDMSARRGGMLVFNDINNESANQTLIDLDGETDDDN